MEKKQQIQLLNIFNSLFAPDNLRKNIYIFKHFSEDLTLKFKPIMQQRQVASITNNLQLIKDVLKKCQLVQVHEEFVKVVLKGQLSVIRVKPKKAHKNVKKEILSKAKNMKVDLREGEQFWDAGFQSQAAANQFIERTKQMNNYEFEKVQKDPYQCLQESIRHFVKERNNYNNPNVYGQQSYHQQPVYVNQFRNYAQQEYPIFIRKAVDSDEEQEKQRTVTNNKYKKKQIQVPIQRVRLDSGDFPSLGGESDKK